MNNNEITFLDNNPNNNTQLNNNNGFIQTIEPNNNNNNIMNPKPVENTIDDTIKIPDWDLTPPFDSIDRGDML